MKSASAAIAMLALLCLGASAQAAVTIDTVPVGDAGNAPDTGDYGSVSYNYSIGKYEVTTGQYAAFLNAVAKTDTYSLYDVSMWGDPFGCGIQRSGSPGSYSYSVASDWANRPVNYVSYWDACRFANWLHNGQPTGFQDASTTERGAYTLDGYNGQDGRTIQRNADWEWAVTSEDEWYKAAYYKGGGTNAGYWLYPTQSNAAPGRDLSDASGNNANYRGDPFPIQSPYYTTAVGEFENSDSAYGTFDQGGNVFEWNEAIAYIYVSNGYVDRGLRGGSFVDYDSALQAAERFGGRTAWPSSTIGFRVVQAVPEPGSVVALLGGLIGMLGLRRRKA